MCGLRFKKQRKKGWASKVSKLLLLGLVAVGVLCAQRPQHNLTSDIARPQRYRPDGQDFVIENGGELFNRLLYAGNTGFRADAGDEPEFSLYLPGHGGNLRFGIKAAGGAKWPTERNGLRPGIGRG